MRAALLLLPLSLVAAESGIDAWLRYAPIPDAAKYQDLVPSNIVALNDSVISPVHSAGQELQNGINGILSKDCKISHGREGQSSIIVGTVSAYAETGGNVDDIPDLIKDAYYVFTSNDEILILGQTERGALYGAFAFLEMLATSTLTEGTFTSQPDAPIRWINQWDNMRDGGTHGSVERGYGGDSIFFWDGAVREDPTRASEYARVLASIGINGVIVNNVNANESTINDTNIDGVARIADVFRPYGIQLGLSLYFASPANLSDLETFDPLDEAVNDWWANRTARIYSKIPDFAG